MATLQIKKSEFFYKIERAEIIMPFLIETKGRYEKWNDWLNGDDYLVELPTIEPNKKVDIEVAKTLFRSFDRKNGMFLVPKEIFYGFGNMLDCIVNPFQNATEEARQWIVSYCQKEKISKGQLI